MSKFTTEVRFICELAAGYDRSKGYNDVDDIITAAAPSVFDFDFPIFDEAYRLPLEKKILRHYYTREINEETAGLWKLRLNARLNEIMPYYNQMYQSQLLQFNPLYDTDLTRDHNKQFAGTNNTENDVQSSGSGTAAVNTQNNTLNWRLFSDTPQGGIQGIEGTAGENSVVGQSEVGAARIGTVLDENVFLTDATKTTNQDNGTSQTATTNSSRTQGEQTDRISNVEDYLEHVVGKSGAHTYSKMLMEYRKTFLNIDMMIIDELSDLFFGLWW